MAGTPTPDWHVQYRRGEADHIECFPTPEQAIEAACSLIDNGCDVHSIGFESLDDSIAKDHIARIYALWVMARPNSK